MSLRGQFFLSVILALLVALSLLAVVACWHARRSVQNEMTMALEAADRIVDNALISLPRQTSGGGSVDAYLVRLTHSFDDNRHVRVALRKGGADHHSLASGAPRRGADMVSPPSGNSRRHAAGQRTATERIYPCGFHRRPQ